MGNCLDREIVVSTMRLFGVDISASDSASASASASSSADPSLLVGGSTMSNSSVSASTSAADPPLFGDYEVFLNFCGQDTRHSFTDFLYISLTRAGIRTFRDDNELRVGEEIGPELVRAISDSKIIIPIFSKNYASKKRCLIELAHMIQCLENRSQKILPIFYDVTPDDVQHQLNSYEVAFRQHKKQRYDGNVIQKWKDALKIVGQIKGLELEKETGGCAGYGASRGPPSWNIEYAAPKRDPSTKIIEHATNITGSLYGDQGTKKVKAFCLDLQSYRDWNYWAQRHLEVEKSTPRQLVGEKFLSLSGLRYLILDSLDILSGDFKHCLQNLRWLRWENLFPTFTATNLHLKNLVILDLSKSLITEDWDLWSQIQMLDKLKVLDLSWCKFLRSVPLLATFSKLERLMVNYCEELCSLDGIDKLESLRYLDATSCDKLKTLPNLSRLTKLKELKVKDCTLITDIPGLDKLEYLEHLDMSDCKSVKRLPDLSNFKRLKRLKIINCSKLIELRGLDGLESLEYMDMGNCIYIETLLDLSKLKGLKVLFLTGCVTLTEIRGLEELKSLEYLNIIGCELIENLPDFSNLRKLELIVASCCEKLTEIRGLENLESFGNLFIYGCETFDTAMYLQVPRIWIHMDCFGREVSTNGDEVNCCGCQNIKQIWSRCFWMLPNCTPTYPFPNVQHLIHSISSAT
ncbi:hypothetical protein LguiB_013464 [Lonicera macranthoides]